MEIKYRRNPFKGDPAYDTLERLESQQDPDSPEARAIEIGSDSILFNFVLPDGFLDKEGNILASIKEVLLYMEKGHAYVAALAPWVEEVVQRATDEQLRFLQKIGLHGPQEEDEEQNSDRWNSYDEAAVAARAAIEAEDDDSEPLPAEDDLDPAEALSVLEILIERIDLRTAEHTCLELAVQTLRYILDTDQEDDFSAFLEKLEKPHAFTEGSRPLVLH